jgi:hypothetical protein
MDNRVRFLLIVTLNLGFGFAQPTRNAAQPPRNLTLERIVPRKQVALVIGNGNYARVGRLTNPVNDADAMAHRLHELRFDVLLLKDGNRRQMGQQVDAFLARLGSGDVALFYYAGHGVQVDGENYLIPVDFEGNTESDIRYDSFALGKIQDRMEHSGALLNMLILDSCRNNPFRLSGRSTTRGLAPMNAGRGTFVAFATAPGSVADDNPSSSNGLFTHYLLEALSSPGLGLDEVFNLVRAAVDAASGGKQLPWTHSSVVGHYSFQPDEMKAAEAVAAEGRLVWSGELDTGQEVDLGSASIAGSVYGTLPGVPVTVEVHPSSVRVLTPPGPENGWSHLVLHNDGKKQMLILVKWALANK